MMVFMQEVVIVGLGLAQSMIAIQEVLAQSALALWVLLVQW